jgi:four helix bundle protein
VEEECDESVFWLELLMECGHVQSELLKPLHQEANEILAMVVASIRTAKGR